MKQNGKRGARELTRRRTLLRSSAGSRFYVLKNLNPIFQNIGKKGELNFGGVIEVRNDAEKRL